MIELNIRRYRIERRVVEQMYRTVDTQVEIYKVRLESNVIDDFGIALHSINVEKPVLTNLPKPRISELKQNHRLRRLVISEETVTVDQLPVHIILGAAGIKRITSTGSNPESDPGAKFTMLGWVIAGKSTLSNAEAENVFFLISSHDEFIEMCSQHMLGLTDVENIPSLFHEDFMNQLQRLAMGEGTYSTRLHGNWKDPHCLQARSLPAMSRLKSTTRKLEKIERFEEYHMVMEQQLDEGILEVEHVKYSRGRSYNTFLNSRYVAASHLDRLRVRL